MIISMKRNASREDIDTVIQRIQDFGYKIHTIEGEERVVIGVIGVGDVSACLESLEAMNCVEKAVRISAPYKFVSKEFKQGKTIIQCGQGVEVGGNDFVVMAGPCSVESEKQILETAELAARGGAKVLRGGAFKPRTSPYDFQGLEEEGLKLLARAREETGLAIVTEVMSDADVSLIAAYADILQVGARNMQNFALLKALGKCGRPVCDAVRAWNPHVRNRHAEHLRHRRGRRSAGDDAPAGDSRSEPRDGQAEPGSALVPRGRRHRRRRPDGRDPSESGQGDERRRAVARSGAMAAHDG